MCRHEVNQILPTSITIYIIRKNDPSCTFNIFLQLKLQLKSISDKSDIQYPDSLGNYISMCKLSLHPSYVPTLPENTLTSESYVVFSDKIRWYLVMRPWMVEMIQCNKYNSYHSYHSCMALKKAGSGRVVVLKRVGCVGRTEKAQLTLDMHTTVFANRLRLHRWRSDEYRLTSCCCNSLMCSYRAMHVVLAPYCYRKSSVRLSVRPSAIVCLSVRLSVTLRYRVHISWTSSLQRERTQHICPRYINVTSGVDKGGYGCMSPVVAGN